jgi:nitrite reductase/ring-hydroxylating ferredoxin subunit
MKTLIKIFAIFIFCLSVGCGGYDNPGFPKVPVNFTINPNEVTYLNLNYPGGSEYLTGGVNGIVVFNIDGWSFSAFDRACPYDWDYSDARIWIEDDGITLRCPRCGSLFNILDGGVIIGPAKYPLKQYFTKYDGWILRVHS